MQNVIFSSSAFGLFVAICLTISACADKPADKPATPSGETSGAKPVQNMTITGIVTAITNGKDGYSADVQTDADGTYSAMVSISNMGGPDKYKSCEVGDRVSFTGTPGMIGDKKQLRVTEIVSIETTQTEMLIGENSFRGITVGDPIAKHAAYTRKSKLKTGEGTFNVYEILDFDNNPAGYLMPDPKNTKLVGDMTVLSPKASTDKNIKVGSTFKELLAAYPNIEVHGSEIEGRTYANAGNISYRLDAANFSYKVDMAKIPAVTKVTEIMINRKVK